MGQGRSRTERRKAGVGRCVNLELEGKTFVVGGGSKGLGRAVAEALLAEGAGVLLVSRDPDAAAGELGDGARPCAADLGTAEGIDAVVAAAGARRHRRAAGELGRPAARRGPRRRRRAVGGGLPAPDRQPDPAHPGATPSLREPASILFVTSSSARVPIPGSTRRTSSARAWRRSSNAWRSSSRRVSG